MMKKLLLTLTMVVALATVASAQLLQRNPVAQMKSLTHKAPIVMKALGANQLIMGPYTSDAIATSGLGVTSIAEVMKTATLLPLSYVTPFEGGEIKSIRIGLCAPISQGAVFIYPVTSLSPLTVGEALVEQAVDNTVAGWNTIDLENPLTISTEGIVGLLMGYQYQQFTSGNNAFPISAVQEGEVLPSYSYGTRLTGNVWSDIGLSAFGNLSVQAIVESENFPAYNLQMSGLKATPFVKAGEQLDYSVTLVNNGIEPLEDYAIDVLINDEVKGQISASQALTQAAVAYNGTVSTEGLATGAYNLTLRVATVAGQAPEEPIEVSAVVAIYADEYPRQKQLVEQFTSQYCTYCPSGESNLQALEQLRDDMAWVAIHGNMSSGNDIYTIGAGQHVMEYLNLGGYPSASFNRTDVLDEGELTTVISFSSGSAEQIGNYLNDYFELNPTPALATVQLSATYDQETRQLKVKMEGEAPALKGTSSGITVYLTEDSLTARQLNNGRWVSNYTHNHVLRAALSKCLYTDMGDDLNWVSDTEYCNEYTTTLNGAWNADNMRIVAFVHYKGEGLNKQVFNCEKLNVKDINAGVQGDVTGDGVVDIADINAVINIMLGITPASNYKGNADITGDDEIDVKDVNAVINLVVGTR